MGQESRRRDLYLCYTPSVRPFEQDTSPEARDVMVATLRQMTPAQKLARLEALNRSVEELARTGIRMRYPNACEQEIRYRLASMWLDRETMRKVFDWDPDQ